MELQHVRHGDTDIAVVTVTGEVDVHSAPTLRDALMAELDSSPSAVLVDLSDVGFLDSTGLGALVAARTIATDRGIALPVVCTNERIVKLFTITGLDSVFDLHPDVAAAIAATGG